MHDFGVREVADILGLTPRQVRKHVRDGLVAPRRGPRGALRFDFTDLVVLRTAKGLIDAEVAPRRLRRALAALRERLPAGRSLAGVQVSLEGDELVVRDGSGVWEPVSGQAKFDFAVGELYARVAPLEARDYAEGPPPLDDEEDELEVSWPDNVSAFPVPPPAPEPHAGALDPDDEAAEMTAADWAGLAETLEDDRRPAQARDALRRALELDPCSSCLRQRLGRLLEQEGRVDAAEAHFRLARWLAPEDAELAQDHGRVLAHLGENQAALDAFEAAMRIQPDLLSAYLGAADIHERLGDPKAALRLLQEVRRRRRD
jgi:tetratricopeptide (TPR) repeat protein